MTTSVTPNTEDYGKVVGAFGIIVFHLPLGVDYRLNTTVWEHLWGRQMLSCLSV